MNRGGETEERMSEIDGWLFENTLSGKDKQQTNKEQTIKQKEWGKFIKIWYKKEGSVWIIGWRVLSTKWTRNCSEITEKYPTLKQDPNMQVEEDQGTLVRLNDYNNTALKV